MTGWMRYRRHSWAMRGETAGAMLRPAIAAGLIPLLVLGHPHQLGSRVEIGAMLPAMLGMMLFRRTEYPQPIYSHARRRSAKVEARTRNHSRWKSHLSREQR